MRWFFLFFLYLPGLAQEYELPLWPDGVPNQLKSGKEETTERRNHLWVTNVSSPDMHIYLPAKQHANGQAVVICPGGGYGGLAYDWEGTDIAKWLNSKGIAGIVLKYRLPSTELQNIPRIAPLQDAKQAIRLVRKNALEWNINEHDIGIMGFSAGGHLAATLGTHYADSETDVYEELSSVSARPNFMVLVYPVISMSDSITHQGSRKNLLGERPAVDMINYYSNEMQVDADTPPTFLIHSADDTAVPVENSIRFYQALSKHGIPVEMHLYPHGGHGYSLALDHGHLKNWPELLAQWLDSLK